MGRLVDADKLREEVLKWMPPEPCGQEEKEYPFETDIVASMMMTIEEAETVPAITLEWIGEYLAWLKGIGGYGLSDARAIQSMIIKWKMDNPQKHSGCGPDYCEIGG